jgi:hypothetical protein
MHPLGRCGAAVWKNEQKRQEANPASVNVSDGKQI